MIYYCNDCGNYFTEDEAGEKEVDLESYYGVGGDFPNHHYEKRMVCPCCDSDEIEEYDIDEDEICELLNKEARTK